MKIVYKTLVLGVFLAVLAVVSPTFAQDVCADIDANQALYAGYTTKYKGTLEDKEMAVAAGKEYIQKYSACKDFEAQVNYLKKAVPKLEEEIAQIKKGLDTTRRYKRFDAALKAGKADEIYASGKDILKYEPEKFDVIVVLAMAGLDEVAVNKNNTYNNDAISYAKSAISKLPAAPESKEGYGVLQYSYKTKEDALGWLNYTIGYIMYYGQKNTDAALPYFYEATQHDSKVKERYFIYELIGDYYRSKAIKLGDEIVAKIEENKKLDPTKNPETYETKMMFALQKGYAERATDAYARAYSIGKTAKPEPKQEYLDGLKRTLETFYKFRFVTDDKVPAEEINTDLMNYVAAVSKKPFPSPTSEVQPVDPPTKEEENPDSANTTTTSSTATPSKPAVKTTMVAPANGNKGKSEADKTNNKPKKRR